MDGILVLQRAEKPKVQLQEAKGLLPDVQLHRIILDILLLDHGPVVKDADRGPVMAVLRTSAKGDVVVLYKACPKNGRHHVRVETVIPEWISMVFVPSPEAIGRRHFQVPVYSFSTCRSVIADAEISAMAPCGEDLDNARCAPRAVWSRLRCVFKDCETLYIAGIQGTKSGQIRHHSVYHHQGIVTACKRGGAPDPYGA